MRYFGPWLFALSTLLAFSGCDVFLPGDVGEEGAPCLQDGDCESGYTCDTIAHKCHQESTVGKEGDQCKNDVDCNPELWCLNPASQSDGVCAPKDLGHLFEECYNMSCHSDLFCWSNLSQPRCLNAQGKPGGMCRPNDPHCDGSARCVPFGEKDGALCVPDGQAAENEPCYMVADALTLCEQDLECDPVDDHCKAPGPGGGGIGDPCSETTFCTAADSYCMSPQNVCANKGIGQEDGACFDNPQTQDTTENWCEAGLMCDGSTCVPDPKAGEEGQGCRGDPSDLCDVGLYCIQPKAICVPDGTGGVGMACYDLDGTFLCHGDMTCDTNAEPPRCEHEFMGLGLPCANVPASVCGSDYPNCLGNPDGTAFCSRACNTTNPCGAHSGSEHCCHFFDNHSAEFCVPAPLCPGQPCEAGSTCENPDFWCLEGHDICIPNEMGHLNEGCFETGGANSMPLCATGLLCGPDHLCLEDPCRYFEVAGSNHLFSMAFGVDRASGDKLFMLHGADAGTAGLCAIDPTSPLSDPTNECQALQDGAAGVPTKTISSVATAWDPNVQTNELRLAMTGLDSNDTSHLAIWEWSTGNKWTVAQAVEGPTMVRSNYNGSHFAVAENFDDGTNVFQRLAWYAVDGTNARSQIIANNPDYFRVLDLAVMSANQDFPWVAAGLYADDHTAAFLKVWGEFPAGTPMQRDFHNDRICDGVLFLHGDPVGPELLAVAHRPRINAEPDTGQQYVLSLTHAPPTGSDPATWTVENNSSLADFINKPTARVTNMVFWPEPGLLFIGVMDPEGQASFTLVLRLVYEETSPAWHVFFVGMHPTHGQDGSYPPPGMGVTQLALSPHDDDPTRNRRWLASAGHNGYAFCDTHALVSSSLVSGLDCTDDADCPDSSPICHEHPDLPIRFCVRQATDDDSCPHGYILKPHDTIKICMPDELN